MSKVIDFETKRQDSIAKRKRNFERVLFSEFLGSYAEIDESGSKHPIGFVDLSHDGCLFQIPTNSFSDHQFEANTDLTIRVYFTKDDFLPLVVNIKHSSEYIDEKGDAYMRYGAEFDKSLPSFQAFEPFIEFIYKFAQYSCMDKGESKVYFL